MALGGSRDTGYHARYGGPGPARILRLLGRDPECAAIDRLLDDARAGAGGALVVRGEPGIGKTAPEVRYTTFPMTQITPDTERDRAGGGEGVFTYPGALARRKIIAATLVLSHAKHSHDFTQATTSYAEKLGELGCDLHYGRSWTVCHS